MANRQNDRRFNHSFHREKLRQFLRRQNSSAGFRHDWLEYQQQPTLSNLGELAPSPDQFGMGWGGNFDEQQHIGGYDYADDVPHFKPNQRGRGYGPTKGPPNNQGTSASFDEQQHIDGYDYADDVPHCKPNQHGRGYGPTKRPVNNQGTTANFEEQYDYADDMPLCKPNQRGRGYGPTKRPVNNQGTTANFDEQQHIDGYDYADDVPLCKPNQRWRGYGPTKRPVNNQGTTANFEEQYDYADDVPLCKPKQRGRGYGPTKRPVNNQGTTANFEEQQHIDGYDYADDVPHFKPNQREGGYGSTKRPLNNQGTTANFDEQYDYADDVPHFKPNQHDRGYGPTKRPPNNRGTTAKKSRKSHNWNNDYGDSSALQYGDSAWGEQSSKDFLQEDETGRETGYYGNFDDCGENYARYDDDKYMGGYDDVHPEQIKSSWSKQFLGNPIARLGVPEIRLIREGNQNEKLVYEKHQKLTINFAGRAFLRKVVKSTMRALKIAGDKFTEELENEKKRNKADEHVVTDLSNGNSQGDGFCKNSTANIDNLSRKDTEQKQCVKANNNKLAANPSDRVERGCPPQVVLGVVRVGSAAKRLLNAGSPSNGSELVLLFKCKPNKLHLETVCQILKMKVGPALMKPLEINIDERNECIKIFPTCGEHRYTTIVRLSSPRFSKDSGDYDASDGRDNTLCRSFCSEALAKIRRIRWFQKVVNQELEVPVIRILLDMSTRLSGWNKLTVYSVEVLVHTVAQKLSECAKENEIHASRILIQSLEVLAGGLLLSGGPSLKDPCEKEPVDVFGYLFEQDAEDLTRAAQTALRMTAVGKLDELLGLKTHK